MNLNLEAEIKECEEKLFSYVAKFDQGVLDMDVLKKGVLEPQKKTEIVIECCQFLEKF